VIRKIPASASNRVLGAIRPLRVSPFYQVIGVIPVRSDGVGGMGSWCTRDNDPGSQTAIATMKMAKRNQ
jgi:hypothetical protein